MTTTSTDRTDAPAERLVGATLDALELHSVYLGTDHGLYRTLTGHGALTAEQLAERAGIARATRGSGWSSKRSPGNSTSSTPTPGPTSVAIGWRATTPAVLVDRNDTTHVVPFAHMLAGIGGVIEGLARPHRSGALPRPRAAFRHGHGHINNRTQTTPPKELVT